MSSQQNKRHPYKPLIHIGIVLAIAATTVVFVNLGYLSEKTPVAEPIEWLIMFAISTDGVILTALTAILVMLLHKKFEQSYGLRKKLRKAFFFFMSFLTGKFYTWSGVLFGLWLMSSQVSFISPSPLYPVYGFGALAVGLMCWVAARELAYRVWRSS